MALEAIGRDPARLVLQLLEPERVGEPPGRIDRHDRDLGAARGHPERDRRRGRRLADPARAGADADALTLQQLGDAHVLGV